MAFRNQLTMCRLCLCEKECFINIFEVNDWQGYIAAEVISDLFQFIVSETDCYPHVVCLTCLTKLTDFKQFKECCQKSLVKYDNMFASRDSLEEHQPDTVEIGTVKTESVDYLDEENFPKVELETVKTEPVSCSDGEGDVSKVQLRFVETVKDPQHLQPLKDRRPYCTSEEETDANLCFGNISTDEESIIEKSTIVSSSEDVEASFSGTTGKMKGQWMPPEGTIQVTPFIRGDMDIRMEGMKDKTGEEHEGVTGTALQKGVEGEELECDHCGDVFTTKDRLVQHVRVHVFGQSYDCDRCGKVFRNNSKLRRHVLSHTRCKQHKCEKCSKYFTQIGTLKSHMRIHTSLKPYECTECSRIFHRNDHFQKHVRTHTGDKPYKCMECSKTFRTNEHLKRHMISHGDSKPHKCVECSKSFSHMSSLSRHKKSHTGHNPYKCAECGKGFTRNDNLKMHMRSHIDAKPS